MDLGRGNTDETIRRKAYADLEQILQDLSNNAPLVYSTLNSGTSKKVHGFVLDPAGYHKLENVTVEK